jgi:glutathione peroxidase-family protein
VASGTLLLTEHPASAYERFDLTIRAKVPDFEFQTIEGSSHRLSDFDGDYVLLFVWDIGCVFAAEEIATVRRAVEKFGGRGFTALGFSDDEDHMQATEFIREREMHCLRSWGRMRGTSFAGTCAPSLCRP